MRFLRQYFPDELEVM